jgi:hypothetical protein
VHFTPSRLDIRELLPWALAEVRDQFPDAELTRIVLQNVRRDGFVDLTGPNHFANVPAEIEIRFVSKAAPRAKCEPRMYAKAGGLALTFDEDCDEPAIRAPRCSPAQVWAMLAARHPDLVPLQLADMMYYDDPAIWNVEAAGYHEQFDDGC